MSVRLKQAESRGKPPQTLARAYPETEIVPSQIVILSYNPLNEGAKNFLSEKVVPKLENLGYIVKEDTDPKFAWPKLTVDGRTYQGIAAIEAALK